MTSADPSHGPEPADDADTQTARVARKLLGDLTERRTKKKDRHTKRLALHLLLMCTKRHMNAPPPIELYHIFVHLLERSYLPKRENPFYDDPNLEEAIRDWGRYLGFDKPRPETVVRVNDDLIPFEASRAPHPAGEWPSEATHEEVADHMREGNTKNVQRWRRYPGVRERVAEVRETGEFFRFRDLPHFPGKFTS